MKFPSVNSATFIDFKEFSDSACCWRCSAHWQVMTQYEAALTTFIWVLSKSQTVENKRASVKYIFKKNSSKEMSAS